MAEDEKFTMANGNFEWNEKNFSSSSLTYETPQELANRFDTLSLDKGETIEIEIESNLHPQNIILNQINENGTVEKVDLKNNEFTLPENEGYYIYEVEAKWKQGYAFFVFDVEVK